MHHSAGKLQSKLISLTSALGDIGQDNLDKKTGHVQPSRCYSDVDSSTYRNSNQATLENRALIYGTTSEERYIYPTFA